MKDNKGISQKQESTKILKDDRQNIVSINLQKNCAEGTKKMIKYTLFNKQNEKKDIQIAENRKIVLGNNRKEINDLVQKNNSKKCLKLAKKSRKSKNNEFLAECESRYPKLLQVCQRIQGDKRILTPQLVRKSDKKAPIITKMQEDNFSLNIQNKLIDFFRCDQQILDLCNNYEYSWEKKRDNGSTKLRSSVDKFREHRKFYNKSEKSQYFQLNLPEIAEDFEQQKEKGYENISNHKICLTDRNPKSSYSIEMKQQCSQRMLVTTNNTFNIHNSQHQYDQTLKTSVAAFTIEQASQYSKTMHNSKTQMNKSKSKESQKNQINVLKLIARNQKTRQVKSSQDHYKRNKMIKISHRSPEYKNRQQIKEKMQQNTRQKSLRKIILKRD